MNRASSSPRTNFGNLISQLRNEPYLADVRELSFGEYIFAQLRTRFRPCFHISGCGAVGGFLSRPCTHVSGCGAVGGFLSGVKRERKPRPVVGRCKIPSLCDLKNNRPASAPLTWKHGLLRHWTRGQKVPVSTSRLGMALYPWETHVHYSDFPHFTQV